MQLIAINRLTVLRPRVHKSILAIWKRSAVSAWERSGRPPPPPSPSPSLWDAVVAMIWNMADASRIKYFSKHYCSLQYYGSPAIQSSKENKYSETSNINFSIVVQPQYSR